MPSCPAARPAFCGASELSMRTGRFPAFLAALGAAPLAAVARLASGADPREQARALWQTFGVPLLALLIFVAVWAQTAPRIDTSLGAIPGPAAVVQELKNLIDEHRLEREKRAAFYARQRDRNAAALAEDPDADVRVRTYTGRPTYFDQILTSLKTVFAGFLLATVLALPLGVMAGLSKTVNAALSPLIQIFKPVSPLAWLPIVTIVVSSVYVGSDTMFEKSFVNSAVTVTLCSLWPALINTALGVASVDRDLINVARVLRLGWPTKVVRIVLPSALPLIFTGLRLSLGVGWMVLIAAEMLAQNPGLGKFVWDEFQNGSSSSLARIIVAVLTIGVVGFLLDRLMLMLQALVTRTPAR
ncbi:MAG: ABC transporter permease [Gammaproteobacteria bacterium]|nr:ABC transporter permease [Gammaproteobacteria bacterium]